MAAGGAARKAGGAEELRQHPLRLGRNGKRAVSGECVGFVRCLSGAAFDRFDGRQSRSAVGFAAVFYGGDANGVFAFMEAHAIVADAQPELRRFDILETLHVAFAGFEVPS